MSSSDSERQEPIQKINIQDKSIWDDTELIWAYESAIQEYNESHGIGCNKSRQSNQKNIESLPAPSNVSKNKRSKKSIPKLESCNSVEQHNFEEEGNGEQHDSYSDTRKKVKFTENDAINNPYFAMSGNNFPGYGPQMPLFFNHVNPFAMAPQYWYPGNPSMAMMPPINSYTNMMDSQSNMQNVMLAYYYYGYAQGQTDVIKSLKSKSFSQGFQE